ncbi:DUF397 domain-containing protein [Actinomadura sp. LD22]|uniref:DUF397 domain-containing protein n=1 Tax=Actinomadura physcomitrii TaxID=2650748 RepID=A0A6I4MD95_9ACTN|nr:DUF397 domain-containing protein [Actinomadura physcomitrii]MWA01967.1 DUF397 domain-containing protein [Actinomadura physcomitrii]
MDAPRWRKSSLSGNNGGACVEVADLAGGIGVRDSKDPGGPKLILPRAAFATLLRTLR